MSTLVYAGMVKAEQERMAQVKGATGGIPGASVGRYTSILAALVPSEVLLLHGAILSVTTTVKTASREGGSVTVITEPFLLGVSFFVLILFSMVLYIGPRASSWETRDWSRMLIPPVAFVLWTMLQRATAFDAVFPALDAATRSVTALIGAAVLAFFATLLSYKV